MIPIVGFICFMLVAFSSPVAAEIYKYVDKNGVVRFTNELSKVPEEYQDDVQRFEKVGKETENEPEVSQSDDRWPAFTNIKEQGREAKLNEEQDAEVEENANDEKRQALIEEKESLLQEREALEIRYRVRKRKSVTRAKIRAIDERLREINAILESDAPLEVKSADYE